MLRMTAIGAGSVEYLIRGCGCAEHDHAPDQSLEADEGLELGVHAERGGHVHDHDSPRQKTGADYLSQGTEHEPAGVWWGEGLDMVERAAGTRAGAADVRAVFGELRHPDSSTREPAYLGSKPRVFKTTAERIEAALAAEPDASEERRWQIRHRIGGDQRKAVAYYDLTFSAPKSVSVYYAGLLAAGREAEAQRVWEAHQAAVDEAMGFVQGEATYVRSGYHGRTRDGRSVGKYEEGSGLVGIRFDHRTSRAQEPQIHSHFAVLNRVTTRSDGKVRSLDGRGFAPIMQGADAVYLNGLERRLTEGFSVVFARRPDGKAREIVGIDQRLLAEASTRRAQVEERAEQLVAEFRAREGRDPGPAAMKEIRQEATLATRAAKTTIPAGRQIEAWARSRRQRLTAMMEVTRDRARQWVSSAGSLSDQRNLQQQRREEMVVAAVAAVQGKYATWTLGNLMTELREAQSVATADGELAQLAADILRDPAHYGVRTVSAPDPGTVPRELQRADGRSIYRAHNEERFATGEQLDMETGIVADAVRDGAPALMGPQRGLARRELLELGLGTDQLAAAVGVLSSGRHADVLIGPAGVGKSRTVTGLRSVWEQHIGGRVMGLATSQKATDNLTDEGMTALNVAQFLLRFAPDEDGLVRDFVRPGDLFVLDEAGMVDTTDVRKISEIVAGGGGKLLYTGDPAQLGAIGAGGMLDLLVRDTEVHRLVEVHRFVHAWEKKASVGLREGDESVLAAYDRHGRLCGGDAEQMSEAAVRGYLADVLAGKSSAIVVNTNEQASELSAQVRSELIRLGRVEPEVLATLRDGNHVGVGDVVQARKNNAAIPVEGPGTVTNRETYSVLERTADGALTVRAANGAIAHLPGSYVQEHVTLAYCGTVNAVQGVTVDTCHALIDGARSRLQATYVAMTRGREANTGYVITQREPDHHDVERTDQTAVEALSTVMKRQEIEEERAADGVSAEVTRRVGEDSGASLASVGTQWDLLTSEAGQQRYTESLIELLGPEQARQVVGERGFGQLVHALRASELSGHNVHAALAEAIEQRSLSDVDSLSDVLRWRINRNRDQRSPEREVRAGDWRSLTEPIAGARGQYAEVLADAASQRQAEMGAQAATQPPAWALHLLGELPADELQRAEWTRRAGVIAAYRDLAAIPESALSLGEAPAREQVFHRALWEQAFSAAGCPVEDLDYRTATDSELRGTREQWRREEAWAPYFVGDELAHAQHEAITHRQDVQLWTAEAQLHPEASVERAQIEADIRTARDAAELAQARVTHLEVIADLRDQWSAGVGHQRLAYEKAGEELARRGLDPNPTLPEIEQLGLFEVVETSKTRTRQERAIADGQLQLDLGDASEDEPITVTRTLDDSVVATGAEQLVVDQLEGRAVDQGALFGAEPDSTDRAAAEPLRLTGTDGSAARVPSRQSSAVEHEERMASTLGEARRRAEISAELRAGRDLRSRTTTWEHDLDDTEEQARVARARRDDDPTTGIALDESLIAERDARRQALRQDI